MPDLVLVLTVAHLGQEHRFRSRLPYEWIVGSFLGWCDHRKFELRELTPGIAGEYVSHIEGSAPQGTTNLVSRTAVPALWPLMCFGNRHARSRYGG